MSVRPLLRGADGLLVVDSESGLEGGITRPRRFSVAMDLLVAMAENTIQFVHCRAEVHMGNCPAKL